MKSKRLAAIAVVIAILSVGTVAVLLSQNNLFQSVEQNPVTNPTTNPTPLTEATPTPTVEPTAAPTPQISSPTPVPFTAIYTASAKTYPTATTTEFTITVTIQSGNGMQLTPDMFMLVGQNAYGDVKLGADITGNSIQAVTGAETTLNVSISGHFEGDFKVRVAWNNNNNIVDLAPA